MPMVHSLFYLTQMCLSTAALFQGQNQIELIKGVEIISMDTGEAGLCWDDKLIESWRLQWRRRRSEHFERKGLMTRTLIPGDRFCIELVEDGLQMTHWTGFSHHSVVYRHPQSGRDKIKSRHDFCNQRNGGRPSGRVLEVEKNRGHPREPLPQLGLPRNPHSSPRTR